MPEHEVQFLQEGAINYQPSTWKVGVPVSIFEAGFLLPISYFFDEVMQEYNFSVHDLTPNGVNKIVRFVLACRALGVLPQFRAFQYFFSSYTQSSVHTFSRRRNTHMFIVVQKAHQKIWQDRWLWVNNDLIGLGYPHVPIASDRAPQLLGISFSMAQTLRGSASTRKIDMIAL